MRSLIAALSLALLLAIPSTAEARHHKHSGAHRHHARSVHHVRHARVRKHHRRRSVRVARAVPLAGNLVTVSTAAGIPITVAANLAGRFQGFIADLVASGYKPRHIGSFARGGHVAHSRHYAGAALDIDQTGWGIERRGRCITSLRWRRSTACVTAAHSADRIAVMWMTVRNCEGMRGIMMALGMSRKARIASLRVL
jgi:hypothetical protein